MCEETTFATDNLETHARLIGPITAVYYRTHWFMASALTDCF